MDEFFLKLLPNTLHSEIEIGIPVRQEVNGILLFHHAIDALPEGEIHVLDRRYTGGNEEK
jgi:hypothetical protein